MKWVFTFWAFLFLGLSSSYSQSAGLPDYYQQGKDLVEKGEKDQALMVWFQAYEQMSSQDLYDPRIGFSFVRLAVELQAENLYRAASEIYFWGLNAPETEPFADEIREELALMEPIVDPGLFIRWRRLLKDHNTGIYEELAGFWNESKIILTNPLNERLIEHWERIHFARENFTKNDNTVYGTDDRGLIYVRLGTPTVKKREMLSHDSSELRNKAYDLMMHGYISEPEQVQRLTSSVMQTYTPQEVEFWRYDDIAPEDRVIYLFGRTGDTGSYGLRSNLEEFIPSEAFRTIVFGNRSTFKNLRAGNFLQFMLYNQLTTVDSYFGRQLMQYEQNWHMAVGRGSIDGNLLNNMNSRQSAEESMRRNREVAPVSISDFERHIPSFDMQVRQYRFWGDDTGPVSFVVMNPDPASVLFSEDIRNQTGQNFQSYFINQGIAFRIGRNGHTVVSDRKNMDAVSLDVLKKLLYGNLLETDELNDSAKVFTEVYARTEQESRNYIIGLASEDIQLSRLDQTGDLVVSDLVLGSTGNEHMQVRNEEVGIILDEQVRRSENLQVYLEAYHFDLLEDGSVYQIQYRLVEEGRRSRQRRQAPVSLIWQSKTNELSDYQFFEVELDQVRPGRYNLSLEITELHTGRKADASAAITVTE